MSSQWFELLLILNVGVALVALLRRRPATFMLAACQSLVLRSLIHIRDFGQPRSQWFIPEFVFKLEALDVAATLFAIGTGVLLLSVVLTPKPPRVAPPHSLEPIPHWMLAFLLLFFGLVTVLPANLFDAGFDLQARNTSWSIAGINLAGANALLLGLFLYEIARRVFLGSLRPGWAVLIIFTLIICTDYSKGSTGTATGLLITTLLIFSPPPTRQWRSAVLLVAALAGVVVMTYVVREIRLSFAESGWSAVSELVDNTVQEVSRPSADSASFEDADDAGIGNQYATHVLECIALYEAGQSRHWRSFYDPLIYTFEPSFLLGPLGITRPQEAPWELAEHFIHGGGIYTTGEFYWNGGYFGVLLGFLLMAGWAFFCDTRYRFSQAWLGLICAFAPPLFEGIGYGFAHVVRGAVNGLLLLFLLWVFGRMRQRAVRARGVPGSLLAHRIRDAQAHAEAH